MIARLRVVLLATVLAAGLATAGISTASADTTKGSGCHGQWISFYEKQGLTPRAVADLYASVGWTAGDFNKYVGTNYGGQTTGPNPG